MVFSKGFTDRFIRKLGSFSCDIHCNLSCFGKFCGFSLGNDILFRNVVGTGNLAYNLFDFNRLGLGIVYDFSYDVLNNRNGGCVILNLPTDTFS